MTNTRVNVLLDDELYELVTQLAEAQSTSRALVLRGLVRAARPALERRLAILQEEPDIFGAMNKEPEHAKRKKHPRRKTHQ